MKKKYVALMAGVAATMAIGAPTAMAALPELPPVPGVPGSSSFPGVPSFPGLPGGPGAPGSEPNGADCSFESGESTATSEGDVEAVQTPSIEEGLPNEGNCTSFGNDQHNGENSGGVHEFPSTGVNPELPGGENPVAPGSNPLPPENQLEPTS